MKPVYMINGFLESGKTEFITYTLAQPYFRIKGKTLIIACEEGEVEYESDLLKKANAVVEWIEEEEDFNTNCNEICNHCRYKGFKVVQDDTPAVICFEIKISKSDFFRKGSSSWFLGEFTFNDCRNTL